MQKFQIWVELREDNQIQEKLEANIKMGIKKKTDMYPEGKKVILKLLLLNIPFKNNSAPFASRFYLMDGVK